MADRGRRQRSGGGRGKRFSAAELDRVKARRSLSSIFEDLGVRFRGRGRQKWALCPFHQERTPSFQVRDAEERYDCFGCGAAGDHIDAVMLLRGMSFSDAVEYLGGRPDEREILAGPSSAPLRAVSDPDPEDLPPPSIQKLWDERKSILGTQAAAYLMARAIPVVPGNSVDLGFVPSLPYWGYADAAADEPKELGRYPAMLGAIRNVAGELIGLHRTYLEPGKPSKLSPPGDQARNKAKKVTGRQRGGLIYLSAPAMGLAIGEGIETTQSWYALGRGSPDVAIASGISLGNLAGSSTGTILHPDPALAKAGRRIPNGEPDLERPGIVLPPWAKEVTLIGDGDSDPVMTSARLLIAGRRFAAQGATVFVDMAPEGQDFNDVLTQEERAEAGS